MKRKLLILMRLLLLVVLFSALASCSQETVSSAENLALKSFYNNPFQSYREIPGITEQEIQTIEALKERYAFLSYGMIPSTEAFIKEDGKPGGYAALFCEWLTELFDIPFKLEIYGSSDLVQRLNDGKVDFSGNIMPTEERKAIYFMTDIIAERKYITIRLKDSPNLSQIPMPRYAYARNTPVGTAIASRLESGTFELIPENDYTDAYEILINNKADAYVATSISESFFIDNEEIVIDDFYPLVFNPTSMAAVRTRPELEAVISIVTKALRNGANLYLFDMYQQGLRDYQVHSLFARLTDEERAYIAFNPVVPVAAFTFDYPLSFYNTQENDWQGIYFDILDEVSKLTGLAFEVGHDMEESMPDVQDKLFSGQIAAAPEWQRNQKAESSLIWSNTLIMEDYYALISRSDHPNITLNGILNIKIGVVSDAAATDIFRQWFPNHANITEYADIEEAFKALQNDETDMVMSTQKGLMHLTHFREQVGYKANITFNQPIQTRLVVSKNHAELAGIIDKALKVMDVEGIVYRWTHRTYDYRAKVAEAQRPWLIRAIALILIVLALVSIIFFKNRKAASLERTVLRDSEERIQLILDAVPLTVNLWTKDYKNTNTNTEAIRLFEVSSKQEYLDNFFDFSPEYQSDGQLSKEKAIKCIDKAFDEGYYRFEWTHKKLDGELLPSEITLVRVKYKNDFVVAGFIRDLREEKAAIEKIRKAEEEKLTMEEANRILRNILDIMPVSVIISHRGDGALFYANKVALDTFACKSFEEVADRKSFDFMPETQPDGSKSTDIVAEFWKQGEGIKDFQFTKLNGESFLGRVAFCYINYFGKAASINVIENITAEKEYQQMLHNTALKEQEANQLKSSFLATMSHEIRTPMNAILGLTEMQLQNKSLPADTQESLERIYNSGNLLLNIINDILDLSKIEAGKLEIVPVKYDILSLINDAVQISRLRYESKPIEFLLDINENTPMNLFGDELRIKQILNNIMSNAFKYTDKGTVKLSVFFEDARGNAVIMVFRVSDTGQGMTEEQVSRLFDEYSRFNLKANRAIMGAGLGMSITKRLLDLMDGEISVISEEGKGSEFTVRIPQERLDSVVCGKEAADKMNNSYYQSNLMSKKSQILREYMPYGNVLVVDDMDINIYVTKSMLLPYGLKVDSALSGFEAIEKVKAGNVYDIIFMDHMMPNMDGIETLKNIRSMGYNHYIIALTANALVGQAEMFLESGFDGYISKPIDSRELNQILNDFIRNKKPPEVVAAARRELENYQNVVNDNEKKPAFLLNDPEAVKLFIKDAENAVNVLENLYTNPEEDMDRQKIDSYEITVHGMKNALSNIGEVELSALAQSLEKAAKDMNLALMAHKTPVFLDAIRNLINKYKSEVTSPPAQS